MSAKFCSAGRSMNDIKPSVGVYEKAMPNQLQIREKFELAARAGYDYLELSIDESAEKLARLELADAELTAWKRSAEDSGMPILSMCLSGQRKYPMGSRDPQVRAESMRILRRAVEISALLGIRIIQLAGYDVYYEQGGEDTRVRFLDNLDRSVSFAASYGVTLAFETMETDFMNTVGKALSVVRKINSPYLQIYPDIGNVTNGAADPVSDLREGRGHIAAAHLKETLPGIFRDLQFGEGHVDFDACIAELKSQKVGMYVTELWYDGKSDPLAYLMRARKFFEGRL